MDRWAVLGGVLGDRTGECLSGTRLGSTQHPLYFFLRTHSRARSCAASFEQHKTSLRFICPEYRMGFFLFSVVDLLSTPQLLTFMQGREGWRIPIEGTHLTGISRGFAFLSAVDLLSLTHFPIEPLRHFLPSVQVAPVRLAPLRSAPPSLAIYRLARLRLAPVRLALVRSASFKVTAHHKPS